MITIPLEGGAVNAHSEFRITLGENDLDMTLDYLNTPTWCLNVYDGEEPVKLGMMLESNSRYNLLDGYGSLLFVGAEPTLDNLGIDNSLIWIEQDG